ncbi:neuroligin-2-like protein, partial [Leptotrombidium deliense]
MMFIHGESYFWGTGNAYDGTVLASYGDVVVITLNYRLGIFGKQKMRKIGFLPTVIDGTLRGNYGLMDIIAALHWIHDNINEIGGDSGNVTLVGHNRGASFVNLLMLSPMGRGLFAKAILMSGAALSSWSLATDAESHAKYVAKAVNCPNYDNVLMVDCLRTKMMDELLKIDVQSDDAFRTSFGPIIDGLVVPSEPRHLMESENDSSHHLSYMYPNMRANTALSGRTTPHHLMYGVTRVESPLLFTSDEEKHGIDFERRDDILRTLVRNVVNYYQEVISLTLINEYTDWSVPSEHPINILDSLIDILGDALVVAPLTSVANMHFKQQQQRYHALDKKPNDATSSKADGPKVFSYVFVYQSESNGYSARLGCVHGDELPYVFGAPLAHFYLQKTLGFFPPNYTKPEVTLSETVMFQWSNFVKYGNPNGKGNVDKERFESVFWPEFDIVQRKYLMIEECFLPSISFDHILSVSLSGMKPKIRDHYHSHRLSFWLNLIPKLEKHGKEESDHLKRHLQDQGTLEEREVSVFERISLKFLSSLQTPGGQKSTFGSQSSSSVTQLDKSTTPSNAVNAVYDFPLTVFNGSGNSSDTRSAIVHQTVYYSTALTITIGVGIFLLVLNVLVFVGVYYHLNKHKKVNAKKYPRVNYADVGQQNSQANSLQTAQCGQYCCDNHHHLCTFNSNELTGNYVGNCGSSDVTVHCALTDEKLCQCGNCHCSAAATQNVCDRSHCLSIIHEFDEHL